MQQTGYLYATLIKPLIDRLGAAIALLVLSPVFVLCCGVLALAHKGKIFFTQPRPGKNEKIFKVIKFRTMTNATDAAGNPLPDAQRLTPLGKFLRKTSLDEIPQLMNVLRGEMSFVGPRPLLVEYLPRYTAEQRRRHEVLPGITGWAQVNGRNAVSWQDRFAHDLWYVENISFAVDLKILFLTVLKVFRAEGISSRSSVTMEKFEGNKGGQPGQKIKSGID